MNKLQLNVISLIIIWFCVQICIDGYISNVVATVFIVLYTLVYLEIRKIK